MISNYIREKRKPSRLSYSNVKDYNQGYTDGAWDVTVCDVDNEARQSNKCEGIANPGGKIKALNNEEECESYKYLGVLEAEDIKHKEIKEKIRKEYFRRVKMILNSKPNWGGGGGVSSIASGKTIK